MNDRIIYPLHVVNSQFIELGGKTQVKVQIKGKNKDLIQLWKAINEAGDCKFFRGASPLNEQLSSFVDEIIIVDFITDIECHKKLKWHFFCQDVQVLNEVLILADGVQYNGVVEYDERGTAIDINIVDGEINSLLLDGVENTHDESVELVLYSIQEEGINNDWYGALSYQLKF